MDRVLFETDYMSLSGFKFIIFSIFTVLFLYLCLKGLIKVDRRLRMKGKRAGVLRILEKAVLFFIVIYLAAMIDEYIHTVVYYKTGHYFEIEGIVENYSSVPGGNGTTFTVDGVEFRCSDNSWGYYPTNEQNKVIKENGQYLKIRYIPHDIQGNVIVYIEQMIPEEDD